MAPKSVILPPGKSETCKFDVLPNDEGPFEYNLIISTKEKTYKLKIIGSSKEIKYNSTIINILRNTDELIEIDPLKSYEDIHLDIFEVQINYINKKLYEDKEIFGYIEDKINEIKYLLTGNKDFLHKNDNQTSTNSFKCKSSNRRRFSIFKKPIVVANIPSIVINNKSTIISSMKPNTFISNSTIEELDENVKDNNHKSISYFKEKLLHKNQNTNNTSTDNTVKNKKKKVRESAASSGNSSEGSSIVNIPDDFVRYKHLEVENNSNQTSPVDLNPSEEHDQNIDKLMEVFSSATIASDSANTKGNDGFEAAEVMVPTSSNTNNSNLNNNDNLISDVYVSPEQQQKAQHYREVGNDYFKKGQFSDAVVQYTQAIKELPEGCRDLIALYSKITAFNLI